MTSRSWRNRAAAFLFLLPALLFAAGPSSLAATTTAYSRADRVNVRSRPGFSGEIVTQLTRGQAVSVVDTLTLRQPTAGEPPLWAKIELPPDSPSWASADFVDPASGLVRADLLNIRSGPTFDHGIIARAKNGTTLKILSPPTGGWIQVAAPPGAVGFVPASWLAANSSEVDAPPAVVAAPANPASTEGTPAIASPTTNAVNTVATPVPRDTSLTVSDNAWLEQFLGRSPTPPNPPTHEATPSPGLEGSPTATPAESEPATEVGSVPVAPTPIVIEPPVVVPANDLELETVAPAPVVFETTSPEEGRWVRREGLVVRPINITAPSFYALKARDGGTLMNFLIAPGSGSDAFREYRGRVVIVTGREYLDRRSLWRATPLLNVETIEAVR